MITTQQHDLITEMPGRVLPAVVSDTLTGADEPTFAVVRS